MAITTVTPDIECQLDTATFPAHAITTITVLSGSITFDVKADCSVCQLTLAAKPAQAAKNVRLYVYVDAALRFNGFIVSGRFNPNGTYTIIGSDSLSKLRNAWGDTDRSYGPLNIPDPSTDTNTVQNLVEASGIDVSLTSIQGADFPIGLTGNVIVYGGNIDILNPLTPVTATVMIDLVRTLDLSVVPNYLTFCSPAGVVTRRPYEIGTVANIYKDGNAGNAWDFNIDEGTLASIKNKWVITGKTLAGVLVVQATASASNALLLAPFEYQSDQYTTPIIESEADAQALADWKLAQTNGVLKKASCVTALTNNDWLAQTIQMDSNLHGETGLVGICTAMQDNWDSNTATTTVYIEWRE